MGDLPHAEGYEDLIVYQRARELALEIFRLTETLPTDETFSLTGQIRRSSRSIGAQIAEAWARRPYRRHFVSKLSDADAEQQETRHWIRVAGDARYWPAETCDELEDRCREIGKLLAGMIAKAHLFCGEPRRRLRDVAPEYAAPSGAAPARAVLKAPGNPLLNGKDD